MTFAAVNPLASRSARLGALLLALLLVLPAPTLAQDEPPTGRICLTLFEDLNEDGLWQSGEPLLAGGRFDLSGTASASYLTTGADEPYCFPSLGPGDYVVTVNAPEGYHLTTIDRVPVSLAGSADVSLSFGAATGITPTAAPTATISEPEPTAPLALTPLALVLGILGLIALALGAGYGAYAVVSRLPSAPDEE